MKRYTFTNQSTNELLSKRCFNSDPEANYHGKQLANCSKFPIIVREERVVNVGAEGNEKAILPDNKDK